MAGKTRDQMTPDEIERLRARATGNTWCIGRKLSEESRKRMSDAMQRRRERWIKEGRLDPDYAIKATVQREKFKNVLKSLLRAAKTKKRGKTADAVGYTRDQLVAHIEAQFEPGMSWTEPRSFSIDHIIPVAEFIRRGITDPKIVNSLANLRPMHPKKNRVKSDTYYGDFDDDLARIVAFNNEFDPQARRQLLTAHFGQNGTTYTQGVTA